MPPWKIDYRLFRKSIKNNSSPVSTLKMNPINSEDIIKDRISGLIKDKNKILRVRQEVVQDDIGSFRFENKDFLIPFNNGTASKDSKTGGNFINDTRISDMISYVRNDIEHGDGSMERRSFEKIYGFDLDFDLKTSILTTQDADIPLIKHYIPYGWDISEMNEWAKFAEALDDYVAPINKWLRRKYWKDSRLSAKESRFIEILPVQGIDRK